MLRWIITLITCATLSATPALAGKTLRDVSRVKGQGASMIQGLGLVVGLNGTGDKGTELAMARPLAAALTNMGNPVSIDELVSSKSAALVLITCHIPRNGAKIDDEFEITISVINSAQSLKGGILLMSPLTPRPGSPVYAFANGRLVIPEEDNPTVATIGKGAQMVRDINTMPSIAGSFDLIIDSPISGWGAASSIASEIDQNYRLSSDRLGNPLARVIDPRTIRVTVPENERSDPGSFFGHIMETDISGALRKLPAQVICDTRAGIIVMTGDVEVSPTIITHKDLTITTLVDPLAQPLQSDSDFAALQTKNGINNDSTTAKLQDLIAAFDQLDVPPIEQIQILQLIHKAGKLHARLIVDGVG
ncbi:MAG: flagellar basal body P-ring protein FlgI [Phycisphaerales bacterium]|nr:flagellar basal body P-ring protein FlgI [Phycisphaerales bacterium]